MSEFEAETVYGGPPTPSRGAKVGFAVALLAAVGYTILFGAGVQFLVVAVVLLGVLYVAIPYLLASLRE